MYKPSKAFAAGCLIGSVFGSILLIAVSVGLALLFREPLTLMMARQQEERLKAPALSGPEQANLDWEVTPLEGEAHSMRVFAGRPLFLHFWNPDCVSCVAEIPSINRLHDLLEGASTEVVSVIVGEEEDLALKVRAVNAQFPVYTVSRRPEGFSTLATPASFVLDAEGHVVFSQSGSAKWDDPATVAYLRSLGGDHH